MQNRRPMTRVPSAGRWRHTYKWCGSHGDRSAGFGVRFFPTMGQHPAADGAELPIDVIERLNGLRGDGESLSRLHLLFDEISRNALASGSLRDTFDRQTQLLASVRFVSFDIR